MNNSNETQLYTTLFDHARTMLLEKVFPKYILKYRTKQFYPVVVGGINMNRCLSSSPRAKKLVDAIFSSDIDLDFVIIPRIDTISIDIEEEPQIFKQVHEYRMRFLSQIVSDSDLLVWTNKIKKDLDLDVTLVIDDKYLKMKDYHVHKVRLVRVKMYIHHADKEVFKSVLVDSPIYASNNVADFRLYSRFFPNLRHPIPYYVHRGVPYATCNYVYYDTVRMIIFYSKALKESTSPRDRQKNFVKYLRYILKFTTLYILINKVTLEKESAIKAIYKEAKSVLTRIPIDDKFSDIPESEVKILKSLINKLSKRSMSNLADIKKIIIQSRTKTNVFGTLKNTYIS